jgi:hypothetical protein
MKKLNSISVRSTLCLGFVLAACSTVDMPRNLPEATEALTMANGGWIVITTADSAKHRGELIALQQDTIFMMEYGALTLIPFTGVSYAKVFLTDYPMASSGGSAVWIVGGVVSSAALGWGAIFAIPLWLIVGGINADVLARDADKGDVMFPPGDLKQFCMFARYPQGLPANVERSRILPSPSKP